MIPADRAREDLGIRAGDGLQECASTLRFGRVAGYPSPKNADLEFIWLVTVVTASI